MLIIFCGFMGAGKSSLLEKLDTEDYTSCDLDHLIEKRQGSISDLISLQGLEEFRKIEAATLLEQLHRSKLLLAIGGGAIDENNIEQILKIGKLVWIDTPFEECWERIKSDSKRPLVALGKAKLCKLFNERLTIYQQAHLRLDAVGQGRVNNTTDLLVQLDEAQRKD